MIIKKYTADTENAAIELAREDLGSNAVIMNIKTTKPKGIFKLFKKTKVEVTAAIDDAPTYRKEERPVIQKEEESAIEKKLNNLQELLEKQVAAREETVATEEPAAAVTEDNTQEHDNDKNIASEKRIACLKLVYNQLLSNEVDEIYANALIGEIENSLKKDSTVDNILGAIYQKLVLKLGAPSTIDELDKKVKYIFFIGPTGVGKTTTIAKIASCLKLAKKANIGLLTADTYRIAAVEQLKVYANILNIPLKVVYSAEELAAARNEMNSFDLVLIDTAGRTHKDKDQRDDIKRLIDAIPREEREVFLVLSVTTKYRDLVGIVDTYKEISDFRLIFTKLDETNAIGNIFNIRQLTGAPLSYLTWGQNVPDDIGKTDAQVIAKQLLGGGQE